MSFNEGNRIVSLVTPLLKVRLLKRARWALDVKGLVGMYHVRC